MASIVTGLGGIRRLTNCNEIKFTMPDLGDGETNKKWFGYQLFCADGTPIGCEESYTPKSAGAVFSIDFSKELYHHVLSPPPFVGLAGQPNPTPQPEMKKEFYVEFWEYEQQLDPCEEAVKGTVSQSSNFTVVNSAAQYYDNPNITSPSYLNRKPKCIPICRNGLDFLYVCGDTTIGWTYYDESGGIVGDFGPITLSGDEVQSIGVGPGNLFPTTLYPDGIPTHIDSIKVFANGLEYWYQIECCCDDAPQLMWLDALGGWSGMSFDCAESIDVSTNYELVCRAQDCANPNLPQQTMFGGRSATNPSSDETRTFTKVLRYEDQKEYQRYVRAFLGSTNYVWIDCDADDNPIGVKFIRTSGQIRLNQKEQCIAIVITGFIAPEYNYPNTYF